MAGKSIKKNYFFSMLYKMMNICLPLITAPYLARVMGAETLGTYSYYYAIAHYFYLIGKMGLNNYGTRQIAMVEEKERNRVFSEIFTQQMISAGVMAVLYLAFCIMQRKQGMMIPMILGLYVIGCLFDIDWLWGGMERFDKIAVKNILVKVLALAGVFVLVKSPDDLWIYTLLMAASMLLGFFTLWIGVGKYVHFSKTALKDAMQHLKPNMILLFPILASNIFRFMDKVMVGRISTMEDLGYYDNAEKIIYAISGLITAFTNVMMPRCSAYIAKKRVNDCKRYIYLSFNLMFFLIGGMAFGCFALADRMVLLFFGKGFISSIVLVRILAVSLLPMIWSEIIRSMWIIPNKMDKVFLVALSLGAVLNVAANAVLIPVAGAKGAAIATIIAEVSLPITQYLYIRKEISYKGIVQNVFPYLISGVIMVFVVGKMQGSFASGIGGMALLTVIGAAIFSIVVCVTVGISNPKMTREIKKLILKKTM